jgi:hypothetical protein
MRSHFHETGKVQKSSRRRSTSRTLEFPFGDGGSAAASAAAAHLRAAEDIRVAKQQARTVVLQGRHCLFRCDAERAACLPYSPRSGTTKKDLLRSKPQIKACSGSSGTRQRSRFRCIRLGVQAHFVDPRGVAGRFLAANSLRRIRPALHSGPASNSIAGLRSPVVRGPVIVVQLAFSVTIVPIVGTIVRESWRAAQLLLGDVRPVPA